MVSAELSTMLLMAVASIQSALMDMDVVVVVALAVSAGRMDSVAVVAL